MCLECNRTHLEKCMIRVFRFITTGMNKIKDKNYVKVQYRTVTLTTSIYFDHSTLTCNEVRSSLTSFMDVKFGLRKAVLFQSRKCVVIHNFCGATSTFCAFHDTVVIYKSYWLTRWRDALRTVSCRHCRQLSKIS